MSRTASGRDGGGHRLGAEDVEGATQVVGERRQAELGAHVGEAAARNHAEETGAKLAYRAATVEELVEEPRLFDVVSAMEVIEHAADPQRFVATAASLVKPGGLLLVSTLNRTLRSFALAIVGAEYVLRWLEPGTHRWEQFVTPLELTGFARVAGLRRQSLRGMVYDPFNASWPLSSDTGVNYLFAATKPDV
jgi:2-polyprenyl-6-hydroxyphenyl methylase/3-demethylubiquinone-9 3-methyltransferase